MVRSVRRLVRTVRWTPESFFASGGRGAWYDPSDISTLWQDAAGTMPVTNPGQVVGRIDDKSGNGHHLTGTATYRRFAAGNLHWLAFDGLSDGLTGLLDLTSNDVNIALSVYDDDPGQTAFIANFNGFETNSFRVAVNADRSFRFASRGASGSSQFLDSVPGIVGGKDVITGRVRLATNVSQLRVNQVGQQLTAGVDGTFGVDTFSLGRKSDGAEHYNGRVYGCVIYRGFPDVQQRDLLERYMGVKAGVIL